MSLFDFPRINFNGNIDVNVPTINNTVFFPLTVYDQMYSRAFLPPRLYFSKETIIQDIPSSFVPTIYYDDLNQYYYIEIEPINTIELLRTWCMTPVGEDGSPDVLYKPYYAASFYDLGKVNQMEIIGHPPGYWNMYGDMGVTMSNVKVTGVQLYNETTGSVDTWTAASQDIPPDVNAFLNAAFDLDTAPASGKTTGLMVETISAQSCYANIFCSNVNLYNAANPEQILFQGNPLRFAALIYSAWRVVNWMPPMSGSGRFCAAVPLSDLPPGEQSALIDFFNANKQYDSRPLKGCFVTFTILEVFENRNDPNVYKNGFVTNPAQSSTMGSITPWYEGDMQTGVIGRNLISLYQQPWYTNTNGTPGQIPVSATPPIAFLTPLNNGSAIFSIDMGNTWPESMSPLYSINPPVFKPAHRGEASFETMALGTLILRCNGTGTEICRIAIDPAVNSRSSVFSRGCIFDFVITDPNLIAEIQSTLIAVALQPPTGNEIQVMLESEYMMSTDQKGLYANEGDAASSGYFVNSQAREELRLRIFQKGVPVTSPVKVWIAEYTVPEAGNDSTVSYSSLQSLMLQDNDSVLLTSGNLTMNNNAIYYFVYDGQYLPSKDKNGNDLPYPYIPAFVINNNYTIMDTGAFTVLRVHHMEDYSRYTTPGSPDYPPTFQVMYDEVFKLYDVVYPIMAHILPFTENVWNNGTMAGAVLQRTDMANWNNILYMPRSRELSASQRELIVAWASQFN
jgi:hypothetical protein